MTDLDVAIEHVKRAQAHLAEAFKVLSAFPNSAMVVSDESLKAVVKAREPKGWVTEQYRCGDTPGLAPWQGRIGPSPHEAHSYGRENGQWCDGFV